jgi:hydrogenase/urease accessory protein HupE
VKRDDGHFHLTALDVLVNRRTLGTMKRKFATVLGATSALAFLTSTAAAHPGHSPADLKAQLAAPLAGPDHLAVFVMASTLIILGASRLALHFSDRRKRRAQ